MYEEINKGEVMSVFSKTKIVGGLLFGSLLVAGCALQAPKVDAYSTLLPKGAQITERTTPVSFINLKNETVYLVAGANFINYANSWNEFHGRQSIGRLVYSQQMLDTMEEDWSPMKITSVVVANLRKNFKEVVVVNDLAEAMDKKAQWVVMFDHVIEGSTASASWTNTTTIDLLDSKMKRAANASFSEYKSYGLAWGNDDVMRFSKYKGQDILRSVNSALQQFARKLDAG